ncbi:MAG: helix-turn-helix domain-containing protein [Actinobacteria bacterium]|nr:helix-turn-helix domain-containing protein [Actinomycetota bacterium]
MFVLLLQIIENFYNYQIMEEEKKFYTVKETTEILGISENEILRIIESKKIPVLKVGRALRISGENIHKFLEGSGESVPVQETVVLDQELKEVFSPDSIEDEETSDISELSYKTSELKDEYDELLKKKQELEEDINYLQIEYEEFREKMKKLVVEELKSLLKKIDNGKLDLEEKSFKE